MACQQKNWTPLRQSIGLWIGSWFGTVLGCTLGNWLHQTLSVSSFWLSVLGCGVGSLAVSAVVFLGKVFLSGQPSDPAKP